ncbi:MAG: heme lyase CcmF/NrfE family subunit [Desulfobacterales bacterium]|nr:MAG: heme lyase CcmF/NrfE family subunit [Desulfobacterales bacterium]
MTEAGYYSILIALFLSVYSCLALVLGIKNRRAEVVASAENAAASVFVFLTVSATAMVYALVTRNFQIEYVARYTNRSLSLLYTLTAFYAGQEGSLLFWSWILSLFTAVVVFQNKNKNRELMPHVLLVLTAVIFFFTFLMIFATNPFKTYSFKPFDGQGLNPLLQNPGMIFHPPALLIGYVGFTVPFAFALAALITGKLGSTWIKTTRKWTLSAWAFLTAGNLLGMEWAYVELGWGGYWAWDPVENASFMPWILATAYLHSVMIQEKRDMLKVWNIVLIIFTFLMTIFGTFITRSGLIASVHSFGESTLGWFFLLFLLLLLFVSLALLVYRLPHLKSRNQLDSLLSRESSFLVNNLFFVGIAFTVLWGTLFPIISEAIRGVKITVGPPFYNAVVTPIGLTLLLLTGICPIIAWRKTTLKKFAGKLLLPIIVSGIAAIGLYVYGIRSPYAFITFIFCIFVAFNLFMEFFTGTRTRHAVFAENYPKAFWKLVTKNKRRYGGHVVHFGVVLIFMAFAGSVFNMEKQASLKEGESMEIKNYTLRFDALSNYPTANKQKVVATLTVLNDQHQVGVVSPEKSLYRGQNQPTTEVAIHTNFKEDLYVILAGYDEDSATFKVLVNPLVVWLWIGGGIMVLGTIIIVLPDRRKAVQPNSRG